MDDRWPSYEELLPAIEQADEQHAFWQEHYREYAERYPDQFVAVDRAGQVLASSPDLIELEAQLTAVGRRPTDVWLEFVTLNPRRWIL